MYRYEIMNPKYVVVGSFSYEEPDVVMNTQIKSEVLSTLAGGDSDEDIRMWIRNRMNAGTFSQQMEAINASGGACLTDEFLVFRVEVPTVIAYPFCQGVRVGDKAFTAVKDYLFVKDSDVRIGRLPRSLISAGAKEFTVLSVNERAVVVRCE